MINEEPLKTETDKVAEEKAEWQAFIAATYGSTSDAPLEQGEQGSYEDREPLR